jgi:NADPH-ferrihemoprotein reductase
LQSFKSVLGDNLRIFNAFSREQKQKVYVQHLLKEQGPFINELLQQKSNFYVCGDAAHMAREVNDVLGQIIAEQRGVTTEKGEQIVKSMRSTGIYQEDVWS